MPTQSHAPRIRTSLRRLAADPSARERALGWVWLAVLLLTMGAAHAIVSSCRGFGFGVDGGYYASIALHVRDGHGFKTNVSILHKADPTFPAPSSVYPLWPLTWGYLARVFPLESVGTWLPAALYVLALLLGYLWLHRVHPRSFFPRALPGLQAGHVLVCVLGFSRFFVSTVFPLVEGLAYTLLFAGFWRLAKLLPQPSWRAGVEAGVWLGLGTLARPQLAVSAGVAFIVLAYAVAVCAGLRLRFAIMLATFMASFVAVVTPWFKYTWSFAPEATVTQILAFASVRSNHVLSHLEGLRSGNGLATWLLDRLSGIPVAYGWRTVGAYFSQYFTFHYALLFVAPFSLLGLARAALRRDFAALREWLVAPKNLPRIFAFGYGSGAYLALHTMHTAAGWYFHRRQGLGSAVFIALMLAYLLLFRSLWPRLIGAALLASGVWLGGERLIQDARTALSSPPPAAPPIVDWIEQRRRAEPQLVLAMRSPQTVGYLFPDVGFHWFSDGTTRADLERMVTQLGVDYVAVRLDAATWWSTRGVRFKRVEQVGAETIYRPDRALQRAQRSELGSGKLAAPAR